MIYNLFCANQKQTLEMHPQGKMMLRITQMTGLDLQASELNAEVRDLAKQADSLIAQSQAEAAHASRQVTALLERSTVEVTEYTKKLRSRITDADYALSVAEKMLSRTIKKQERS